MTLLTGINSLHLLERRVAISKADWAHVMKA